MEEMKQPPSPPVQEQGFAIPPGHNRLVVRLHGHSYVSVALGDQEIASNHTPVPVVTFSLAPGAYTVRTDGVLEDVASEAVEQPPSLPELLAKAGFLRLSTDAPDRHVVDGIGEIAADGAAFTTITVEKVDADGKRLTTEQHDEELFLRTTGGMLANEAGAGPIRSVQFRKGTAAFRLVSEKSPKVVTVSVLSRNPAVRGAEIQIEFV